jgi:hypothetical protein
VGPDVVVASPALDDDLGLAQTVESLAVEQLIAKAGVEALDVAVLPRTTIALGIFATGVAASALLILAHDRPFIGELSIKPDPLLQVMPEIAGSR